MIYSIRWLEAGWWAVRREHGDGSFETTSVVAVPYKTDDEVTQLAIKQDIWIKPIQ